VQHLAVTAENVYDPRFPGFTYVGEIFNIRLVEETSYFNLGKKKIRLY
jgi:hypothetical protein